MDAQNRWWVSGWLAADLACLHLDLATMRRWCNWRQDNKKTWRTGEKKKSTRSLSVEWLPVRTEEQVHFTKSQNQQLRSGGVQVLERKTGGRCKAHDKVRRTEERAGEAMAVRYTWKNKRSTLVEEEASPLARCPPWTLLVASECSDRRKQTKDGVAVGRMVGRTDGQADGRMEGRKDGQQVSRAGGRLFGVGQSFKWTCA